MKTEKDRKRRNTVRLEAFDKNMITLSCDLISIEDYYNKSNPIIDDEQFRSKNGIRAIFGVIFSPQGIMDQVFLTTYTQKGVLRTTRSAFANGVINESGE